MKPNQKPTQFCAGPIVGTISKSEAEAVGQPRAAGMKKRGVMRGKHLVPCGAPLDKAMADAKAAVEKKENAKPGDELGAGYGCEKCGRTDGQVVWTVPEPDASPDPKAA